ncbi:MAG: PilN domain-containing protein [Myxococcota bacterium]
MKFVILILLNFAAIGCFLMFASHENKKLLDGLEVLGKRVEADGPVWLQAENLSQLKNKLEDKIASVTSLDSQKIKKYNKLAAFLSNLPKQISLESFSLEGNTLKISGRSESSAELESFLARAGLKLVDLKKTAFEAVGNL